MTAISISVAGNQITDVVANISGYLREHPKTVCQFDRFAGTSAQLTPALIAATRVVNSRISKTEEQWFLERDASAPRDAVLENATLAGIVFAVDSADAGLDAMARLWRHYLAPRRRGVWWSKVSKCLYLLHPDLYPILDSRLGAKYRPVARRITSGVQRVDDGRIGIAAFWAAVRRDLVGASEAIRQARSEIAECTPELGPALDALSDLRLLDICAWRA